MMFVESERRIEQMGKGEVASTRVRHWGEEWKNEGLEELKMALIARKHRMHGRKTIVPLVSSCESTNNSFMLNVPMPSAD